MKRFILIAVGILYCSTGFCQDNLIIDSQTRVVRSITTDSNPTISSNEIVIPMQNHVTNFQKGMKLDVDNVTLVQATAQELSDYQDIIDSKRAIKKQLLDLADSVINDQTTPNKIKNFVSKLKDYLA